MAARQRRQKSSEVDRELKRAAISALAQGAIRAIIEIILGDTWHRGLW